MPAIKIRILARQSKGVTRSKAAKGIETGRSRTHEALASGSSRDQRPRRELRLWLEHSHADVHDLVLGPEIKGREGN
jgi:hypothetical protein